MRFPKLFLFVAAGLVSAALSYFGTGLHPIWWLLWLAPIPVLAISRRLGGGSAFLLGSIAWLIGEMNQWNYYGRMTVTIASFRPVEAMNCEFARTGCGFS
jgi:hypothetical protein